MRPERILHVRGMANSALSLHTPTPDPNEDQEEPDVRQPPVPPDQEPDVVPVREPPKPGENAPMRA